MGSETQNKIEALNVWSKLILNVLLIVSLMIGAYTILTTNASPERLIRIENQNETIKAQMEKIDVKLSKFCDNVEANSRWMAGAEVRLNACEKDK